MTRTIIAAALYLAFLCNNVGAQNQPLPDWVIDPNQPYTAPPATYQPYPGPGLLYPPPPLPQDPNSNMLAPTATGPEVVQFTQPIPEEIISGNIEGSPPPEPVMTWYQPWTWTLWNGWDSSIELGTNGSAGNSESFSFNTGTRLKRKTDINQLDIRLTYQKTQANGIETQNNALLFFDYERFFKDSKWSAFSKTGLEYDEFKAFDIRINQNWGLGYAFIRTDDLTLATRFGSGLSREIGGPDDSWVPEALFGFDYDHQLNKRNKVVVKLDYFPEWGDFGNYRVVTDLAWEMLLREDGNLSFKLAANDRYDSTPNGRKPNDINYSAMLLYKF